MPIDRLMPWRAWDRLLSQSTLPVSLRIKAFRGLDPGLLEAVGRRKAVALFRRAAALVPAYAEILAERSVAPERVRTFADFLHMVPILDKESYVRRFPLASRCVGGRLPTRGFLEESSGTCSAPTLWARSAREEAISHSINRVSMAYLYGFHRAGPPVVFVNAYSLGAWAGGQRFAARMAALGIVRNTGPDAAKALGTLREFGTGFRFLIAGYPPFLKDLVDRGDKLPGFAWGDYRVDLMAGGEGFDEGWRDYVRARIGTGGRIYSFYGAIDLDVGIAMETPLSLALRRRLAVDPALRRVLLGTDRLPCYLGQYSPTNSLIRRLDTGEIEVTILNRRAAAPLIRYNIADEGGSIPFAALRSALEDQGWDLARRAGSTAESPLAPLAFVYLFGRSDGTVFINGAMIAPIDIEHAVYSDPELAALIHSFQIAVEPDDRHTPRLRLDLELRAGASPEGGFEARAASAIVRSLSGSNECYRHAMELDVDAVRPEVRVAARGGGPFSLIPEGAKRRPIRKS